MGQVGVCLSLCIQELTIFKGINQLTILSSTFDNTQWYLFIPLFSN